MKIWFIPPGPLSTIGSTYDCYFNVSSTEWYRIQLFRNNFTSWELYLNNTTVAPAAVPDDTNTWFVEESYIDIQANFYDGTGIGFDYDQSNWEVKFWINKTLLSKGYASLAKPYNCTMFSDTHDTSPAQTDMVDRAPNNGIVWYNCWSPVIPEYDWMVVPVFTMFALFLICRRKKRSL